MIQKSSLCFLFFVFILLLAVPFALASKWTFGPSPRGTYGHWQNKGCLSGSLEYTCVQSPGGGFLVANDSFMNETFPFPDFNLTSMNSTIHNITLFYHGKKSNSTSIAQISPLFVSNGSEFVDSALIGFLNVWDYREATFDRNPFTGSSWTAAEFNDLEAGMQSSGNNTGTNIDEIFIVVDYS